MISNRVLSLEDCCNLREQARSDGRRVVLTNGCFDILHRGHVEYLAQSALLGDLLIVALNSDVSVRALKGSGRPFHDEQDRAATLAGLRSVDAVTIFPGPRLADEIRALKPDVYTKASDYTPSSLDSSEKRALEEVGSKIHIIDLLKGRSTTQTLQKIVATNRSSNPLDFCATLDELSEVLASSAALAEDVTRCAQLILECLKAGGKVLTCGNGGSAADALHLAEELVGRYRLERRPLPAFCLNADVTAVTCIANDFGYEEVFARSVEALGKPGDVLVGFSTSGNSPNVVAALRRARVDGLKTVLLTGKCGGAAKAMSDLAIVVPSGDTARIQEIHTVILHQWLEFIDRAFSK